jgi:hypothetical protein
MRTNYVLIDYENVKVRSLAPLREEHFHVKVFLGPNNTKVPVALVLSMKAMGQRAEFVTLKTMGRNALGFHLAYYLGSLAAADKTASFHIISGDCSFDSLLRHLKTMNIHVTRSESIEKMPCFVAPPQTAKPAVAPSAPKLGPQTVPESRKEAPKERGLADPGSAEGRPRVAPPGAVKSAAALSTAKAEPQTIPESRKEIPKTVADSEEALRPAAIFTPSAERQTFPLPESKEEALQEKAFADFLQRKA